MVGELVGSQNNSDLEEIIRKIYKSKSEFGLDFYSDANAIIFNKKQVLGL